MPVTVTRACLPIGVGLRRQGSADVFNPANGLIDFSGKRLLRVLGFSHGSLLLSLVSWALCVVPNEPVRLVVPLERAPYENRGRLCVSVQWLDQSACSPCIRQIDRFFPLLGIPLLTRSVAPS